MRLDRILSNSGYGSRSDIRLLIRQGRVAVDGAIVRDPGYAVAAARQAVLSLDGQPLTVRRYIHLVLNKPAGLVTALEDSRLPTIADLIPQPLQNSCISPVGRLDRDATGLLILTNDGTLNHRLASPRWGIWKTYRLTHSGAPLSQDQCRLFAAGLVLPDGQTCRPAVLKLRTSGEADLMIHEGKFHQVKRMLQAIGREVLTLHRIAFGPLKLDEQLQPGDIRLLQQAETDALYQAVQLHPQ